MVEREEAAIVLTIKLLGDKTIADRLDHILHGKHSRFSQALERVAIMVAGDAKEHGFRGRPRLNAPTGRLRSSITHKMDRMALRAFVGTNVEYGPIHEFGGIIKPVRARRLAWIVGRKAGKAPPTKEEWRAASRAGKARFAKQVTIPARPYLGPALQANRTRIEQLFAYQIDKLLDGK